MDFGTGMGSAARNSSVISAAGSAASFCSSAEYLCNLPYQVDTVRADDLLNFSSNDASLPVATTVTNHVHRHCDTQFMDASSCFQSPQSPLDLYVPCEEAAELEWLSRFVDESFSDRISNSYQYAGAILPTGTPAQLGLDDPAVAAPARGARSKWSEAASGTGTADAAWTSSLLPLPAAQTSPSSSSSSSSADFPASSRPMSSIGSSSGRGKKGGGGNAGGDGGVRRCTHCASEKTPQWRTGPLGPKTLCNACGVRYKSGRLVPEYRPAASPTFVLTQHSNSHRKVMELRRQKELHLLNNAVTPSVAASWPELHFADHHQHQQQQNGVC